MITKALLQKDAKNIEELVFNARLAGQGDWRRGHLGASGAGQSCDRKIWMDFRWTTDPKHGAQLLALFDRGHLEEERFTTGLRAAGITVWDVNPETGEQWRVKWGHIGGSCDGVAQADCILGGAKFLLEYKTHSVKSFARLKAKKVRSAKKEHWIQMQLYMLGMKLDYAYYMAVEKNTDELYTEFVAFDKLKAEAALERVQGIVNAKEAPSRMEQSFAPCIYRSKEGQEYLCQHFEVCHGEKQSERNCRTCLESNVTSTELWSCDLKKDIEAIEAQKQGCHQHVTLPGITTASIVSADKEERRIEWAFPSGKSFVEGPDAIPKSEAVERVCKAFNGKVIG
jgi:hypothetical protein